MPLASSRHRPLSVAVLGAIAATLAACSSGGGGKATSVAPAPSAEQRPITTAERAEAMSPGGVTTRLDVPPESTEEGYAQACLTAKAWMEDRGGDPHSLVEPYLKEIQSPAATAGRATFQKTWGELTKPQQAAVIVAVRAAADGGC